MHTSRKRSFVFYIFQNQTRLLKLQFRLCYAEIHCIFNETQFVHGYVAGMPSPHRRRESLRFYRVNDQITFHCNHPDAKMEGSNRLTCTQGGKWNQDFPFCHQLPCSKIPR